MRKTQLIILIVALAMGGGAAYLTQSWINAQMKASAGNQPAGHIVIAAQALAYGATVTSDSISEVPWFTSAVPEGAFTAKDDLLNGGRRIVLSPLKRGEPILSSKVTGPGQRASLAALLEEGKRAVTVRVDDVRGVAGFVLPGDFVDFVMIANEASSKRQSYSDILLEHVKVLGIDQIASESDDGKPTIARAVTVEVTKEQAQKILLAMDVGKLSLILSRRTETNSDPNRRISERDIGRIIPEPVRPAAPPPAPVAAPPPAPSNKVKVFIVRNGETKEYLVTPSDEGRVNRAHSGASN
jgi:pilus assembly protein CpaB